MTDSPDDPIAALYAREERATRARKIRRTPLIITGLGIAIALLGEQVDPFHGLAAIGAGMVVSAALVGRPEARRPYVRYIGFGVAIPYVVLRLARAWGGRNYFEPCVGFLVGLAIAFTVARWIDPELREIYQETRMGKRTRPP
jgi:hypothetical protein